MGGAFTHFCWLVLRFPAPDVASFSPLKPFARRARSEMAAPRGRSCKCQQTDHFLIFIFFNSLDKIFSSPILVLRDHTSLAATCRAIRAAYYSPANSKGTAAASPLWRALMVNRQPTTLSFEPECLNENKSEDGSKAQLLLLERIWSGGLKGRTSEKDMEVLKRVEIKEGGKGTGTFQSSAIRSDEWDQAIGIVAYSVRCVLSLPVCYPQLTSCFFSLALIRSLVFVVSPSLSAPPRLPSLLLSHNAQRVTKTEAKSIYKINDKQLYTVTHEERRNPHHKHGAPMQLFNEAAVESVALKLHGGAFAHAELYVAFLNAFFYQTSLTRRCLCGLQPQEASSDGGQGGCDASSQRNYEPWRRRRSFVPLQRLLRLRG